MILIRYMNEVLRVKRLLLVWVHHSHNSFPEYLTQEK